MFRPSRRRAAAASAESAAPAPDSIFAQPPQKTVERAEQRGFDDFFTAPAPARPSDGLFSADDTTAEQPFEEPVEQNTAGQGFVEPEDVLVYEVTLEQLMSLTF